MDVQLTLYSKAETAARNYVRTRPRCAWLIDDLLQEAYLLAASGVLNDLSDEQITRRVHSHFREFISESRKETGCSTARRNNIQQRDHWDNTQMDMLSKDGPNDPDALGVLREYCRNDAESAIVHLLISGYSFVDVASQMEMNVLDVKQIAYNIALRCEEC